MLSLQDRISTLSGPKESFLGESRDYFDIAFKGSQSGAALVDKFNCGTLCDCDMEKHGMGWTLLGTAGLFINGQNVSSALLDPIWPADCELIFRLNESQILSVTVPEDIADRKGYIIEELHKAFRALDLAIHAIPASGNGIIFRGHSAFNNGYLSVDENPECGFSGDADVFSMFIEVGGPLLQYGDDLPLREDVKIVREEAEKIFGTCTSSLFPDWEKSHAGIDPYYINRFHFPGDSPLSTGVFTDPGLGLGVPNRVHTDEHNAEYQ